MKHRLATATLAALVLLNGPPAATQDFSSIGGQYIDFGASMMAVGQMNNVLGSTVQHGGRAAGPSAERKPGSVDIRYRASPAVSARVLGQFADFVAKADPANGDRLRKAIQQKDLLGAWERHVAVDGLRRGDVADAMTAYWVQNWQIANTIPVASKAQVQAVRGQVSRALSANPVFARLDDAGRQELAEVFMLNFVAQGSAFFDAATRGDKALSGRLSGAAAARFRKATNVDPRQLKLTQAGFAR